MSNITPNKIWIRICVTCMQMTRYGIGNYILVQISPMCLPMAMCTIWYLNDCYCHIFSCKLLASYTYKWHRCGSIFCLALYWTCNLGEVYVQHGGISGMFSSRRVVVDYLLQGKNVRSYPLYHIFQRQLKFVSLTFLTYGM
jgi:hypothetical protein